MWPWNTEKTYFYITQILYKRIISTFKYYTTSFKKDVALLFGKNIQQLSHYDVDIKMLFFFMDTQPWLLLISHHT